VPELPDIVVYIEALERRIVGHVLERVLVAGPFLLRTRCRRWTRCRAQVTAIRRLGSGSRLGSTMMFGWFFT